MKFANIIIIQCGVCGKESVSKILRPYEDFFTCPYCNKTFMVIELDDFSEAVRKRLQNKIGK